MNRFFDLLSRHIRKGILHVQMPDGTLHQFGTTGQEATWIINDKRTLRRIALNAEMELGQTYMEGAWDTPDLPGLLTVLRSNFRPGFSYGKLAYLQRLMRKANAITRSYNNVAHHYDVREEVYRLFLDREMFYSCAYYRDAANTLEQAQIDKADHICRKLRLEPGMSVLDIGCGWGSLAFRIASTHDVEVTGITLSKEQLRVAREEARKRGANNVRFLLADYREHEASYDRVVSVGMLEHVGPEYLAPYFTRVRELLKSDGAALIHTIGNTGSPLATNPWLLKYIFPGGYIPTLSELAVAVEKSGLLTTDVESLRLHYATTLQHWHERFSRHRDMIRELMGDGKAGETFCRMWEFYLAGSESSFLAGYLTIYQYQLATGHGIVPITREYLYE